MSSDTMNNAAADGSGNAASGRATASAGVDGAPDAAATADAAGVAKVGGVADVARMGDKADAAEMARTQDQGSRVGTDSTDSTDSTVGAVGAIGTVGMVGLGLMGTACAQRLSQAGFPLHGFDVDAGRTAAFTGERRTPADSLASLARASDAIVLAVFDTTQVEQTIEGPGGILEATRGLARRPVVLCTSTCDPERIAALAARCREAGLPFVEVPVSGTSRSMAQGDAVGLVAGEPADIASATPVLDALCPHRHLLGAAGNGGRAKLAVNLVLGLHRGAMAEGLVFAERLGLDPSAFLKVLIGSAAYSRVMEVKGESMAARRFDPPQSRVDQSLKDFGLIATLAAGHGQPLPFTAVYTALLQDNVRAGEAALDNAVIIEAIARLAVTDGAADEQAAGAG
jgi:putative dehydrogenase